MKSATQDYADRKAEALGLPRIDATDCRNEWDVLAKMKATPLPRPPTTHCGVWFEVDGWAKDMKAEDINTVWDPCSGKQREREEK